MNWTANFKVWTAALLAAVVAAAMVVALVFTSPAQAAFGSLDTSFSGDGKLTTGFGGSDGATGVAIQADGKIVRRWVRGRRFRHRPLPRHHRQYPAQHHHNQRPIGCH